MKNIIATFALILATVGCADTRDPIDRATDFVADYEKFYASAYTCPAGVKTIGYGCTDKDIVAKGKISKSEALTILRKRIIEEHAWVIKTFGTNLTPSQQVALVSAAFNIGHDGLCWKIINGKRVHTRFYNAVIARDWSKAQRELQDWNRADGKVLKGLKKRRAAEGKLLICKR